MSEYFRSPFIPGLACTLGNKMRLLFLEAPCYVLTSDSCLPVTIPSGYMHG